LTKFESIVLETIKEHVDPTTVAVAAINHLQKTICQQNLWTQIRYDKGEWLQ